MSDYWPEPVKRKFERGRQPHDAAELERRLGLSALGSVLKYGRYTAEAIARRRMISDLVRAVKALARDVHSGGQAIVGTVECQPPPDSSTPESLHNAKQLTHAPQPAMRSPNEEPKLVSIASNAERPMSDARRDVAGGTEGK
jgi:hypothetical protein